jgi:D-tyrosyl-tRNA(Tyr) deacylase
MNGGLGGIFSFLSKKTLIHLHFDEKAAQWLQARKKKGINPGFGRINAICTPNQLCMRAVIQRVSHAKVEINGEISGQIGPGLLLLLGITATDGPDDIAWLVRKVTQLRIFQDEAEKMNLAVQDIQGGILVVSQFTLFGEVKKGNRPSFVRAAPPETAIPLYEAFLVHLRAQFSGPVETGRFGASMQVFLLNDGPVTLVLDSTQPDF